MSRDEVATAGPNHGRIDGARRGTTTFTTTTISGANDTMKGT